MQYLVYPDQYDFIPTRSMAINLKTIFLNLHGSLGRAILTLDAVKVFDSTE